MDIQPYQHLLLFAASGVIAYWWLTRRPARTAAEADEATDYELTERASMPDEIARGKLVISEQVFYRNGARPFAAKTDQGFLTPNGLVVLVESKTRARMSASDLVQLSSQAVAIKHDRRGRKFKVAPWGYIRLAPVGRRPYYQRVDLLPESRIDQLWERWKALRNKKVAPIYRPDPSRCRTCLKRSTCPQALVPKVR